MNFLVGFLLLQSAALQDIVKSVALSGRVLLIGETDADRLHPPPSVPPGVAPVLSFRYMEGAKRGRFNNLDLVVDDAGH